MGMSLGGEVSGGRELVEMGCDMIHDGGMNVSIVGLDLLFSFPLFFLIVCGYEPAVCVRARVRARVCT